jgi:hypothetical protein
MVVSLIWRKVKKTGLESVLGGYEMRGARNHGAGKEGWSTNSNAMLSDWASRTVVAGQW